jgi:hypothetical protein|tara:strand:- start:699 stop:1955 length:1257 start_codon:yes stop_codon:yes gene_type:complete
VSELLRASPTMSFAFATICALAVPFLVYARIVAYTVGPGAKRFVLLTPVLVVNVAAPLFLIDQEKEVFAAAIAIANFGWWTNFKIIALACGRGQLVSGTGKTRLTTPSFLALAALPVKFATVPDPYRANAPDTSRTDTRSKSKRITDDSRNARKTGHTAFESAAGVLCKLVLLAGCMALLPALAAAESQIFLKSNTVRNFVLSFTLYFALGALFDAGSVVGLLLFKTQTSLHFDLPFLSHSFSNFWAKRWNLVAGRSLIDAVYLPILEGRWVREEPRGNLRSTRGVTKISSRKSQEQDSPTRRLLGTHACFAMSGLMHEYVFWALRVDRIDGIEMWPGWFTFFAVQAPLVCLEYLLAKKTERVAIPVSPTLFRITQTVTFLVAQLWLANIFFFPPLTRNGLDQRMIEDIRRLLGFQQM